MSDIPNDQTPELRPIAPHLAPMVAATEEAKRRAQEEEDLRLDRESILRTFKRGGLKMAIQVGLSLGWAKYDIEALFVSDAGSQSPHAPDHEDDEGTVKFVKEKKPVKPLPDDCPVVPLGMGAGDGSGKVCFYLCPNRQLVAMESHGGDQLRRLFGTSIDWMWQHFPKFNEKDGRNTGIKFDRLSDSLIAACGRRGAFNPAMRLRGVGAWRDDDGGLILHTGEKVFIKGEWCDPGFIGDHVYPGDMSTPLPVTETVKGDVAEHLLKIFDTWPWKDDADADWSAGLDGSDHRFASLLLLGFVGTSLIGGALKWRPMVWITGEAGSGKSTLQDLFEYLMGGLLVKSTNATPAGIYQTVGYSSRAVAIDESEPDSQSQKMKHMMDLIRQSASGGLALRGSNDHKSKGFECRSSFFMSSILIPPMESPDVGRICILELGTLGQVSPIKFTPSWGRLTGRQLLKRIMDHWTRWNDTLELYRAALANAGHDSRGCDQYGPLLAMSDLLRFDEPLPSDAIAGLIEPLANRRQRQKDADAMLMWLLSIAVDNVQRGGNRLTIRALIESACAYRETDTISSETSRKILETFGVFVDGVREDAVITLPNQSRELGKLFYNSRWYTTAGAVAGGWKQAMERLPHSRKINSRRIGGRGVSVPAWVFLMMADEDEIKKGGTML